MQRFETVAIVGVGLIGASVGLALQRRGMVRQRVGIGRSTSTLRQAKARGAVDRTTTDLERGVAEAELIVVATPVASIVPLVKRAAAACPPGSLITDVGSIKAQIVAAVEKSLGRRAHFVGSHPLAGSEQAGPLHARDDLFHDRVVVVTPTSKSQPSDIQKTSLFWTELGARVVHMTPQEHDRAVAATSHLPHLVASAIAASTPDDYLSLVAQGWLDTTRVASGDPELWQQILLANRKNVLRSLDRLERTLDALRTALVDEKQLTLKQILAKAKHTRDALGS